MLTPVVKVNPERQKADEGRPPPAAAKAEGKEGEKKEAQPSAHNDCWAYGASNDCWAYGAGQ